jgi:hypothetical protein
MRRSPGIIAFSTTPFKAGENMPAIKGFGSICCGAIGDNTVALAAGLG